MNREMQERLTRVGPGTAMGDLLRQYWFPVATSIVLTTGTTRAVRLLAEDLVLFRQPDGNLGLVQQNCSHRNTSLQCGAVDDEGIACPYHGWKFDRQGNCLHMPAEQHNTKLLERARISAYRVKELGGLIFAYLGPEPAPLLPRYDLFVWDNVLRDIGTATIPCNWLQIMENSVDPTHVEWLHGHHLTGVRNATSQSTPGWYTRHHIEIGFDLFDYGIIKRRVLEGGSREDEDWQTGHPLIFPVMLRVGTRGQHRFQIRVPVDDTTTQHYWYSCYKPVDGIDAPIQHEVPVYDVPWQDDQGNFIVDYVDGADIMVWVTQGAITDRTKELLVSSDHGIILLRRLLLEQIDRVQAGEDPMGVIRNKEDNQCIEFAQEHNKFSGGDGFLRQAIELSHVRYSPIKDQIIELLGQG